jgi:hypothetical protein
VTNRHFANVVTLRHGTGSAGQYRAAVPDHSADRAEVGSQSGDRRPFPLRCWESGPRAKRSRGAAAVSPGHHRQVHPFITKGADPAITRSFSGIAGTGRYLAFESLTSTIVPGDTNDREDLFRKDVTTGSVERVNLNTCARALVAADDITHATMAEYLDYVRKGDGRYVTVQFPVEDGLELSSWTGSIAV